MLRISLHTVSPFALKALPRIQRTIRVKMSESTAMESTIAILVRANKLKPLVQLPRKIYKYIDCDSLEPTAPRISTSTSSKNRAKTTSATRAALFSGNSSLHKDGVIDQRREGSVDRFVFLPNVIIVCCEESKLSPSSQYDSNADAVYPLRSIKLMMRNMIANNAHDASVVSMVFDMLSNCGLPQI